MGWNPHPNEALACPMEQATSGSSGPPSPPFFKRLQRRLLGEAAWMVIYLLRLTWRIEIINSHHRQAAEQYQPKGAMVLATWHESCLASIVAHRGMRLCLLVSPSTDGDLVALVAGRLGLRSVRGSSTRGGRAARDAYLRMAPAGFSVGITVDGPWARAMW